MFRAMAFAGIQFACLALMANAEDDVVLVEEPGLSDWGRASCYYFEERPSWYRIENSALSVEVTYPPEVHETNQAGGFLSFQVNFKDPALIKKSAADHVVFGHTEMGPLAAMLLSKTKFVAMGCLGSHMEYIYIADVLHPDRGIGISCRKPRLSPNGELVVFDSAYGRVDYNSCTYALSLNEGTLTPYRVYPPGKDFAEPGQFDEVGWSDIDNWYGAKRDECGSCANAQGWARHRFSITAWNPAGTEVAFIDSSYPQPEWDESGRVCNDEGRDRKDIVVLDFSKGLPATRAMSLFIDEAAFEEGSPEFPKFNLYRSTIRWKDDKTVVVDAHSSDPRRWPAPRYELEVTEDLLNRTEWPPFLEAARKFAGEPVAAPTPDPEPPCP